MQAKTGEPTATVDEVRAALNAEAEAVMNNSVPTPSPADMDKYLMGGHLDDKEESNPPAMPPVAVQQAMLEGAAPNPPVDEKPEDGLEKPPPGTDPPLDENVIDNTLPEPEPEADTSTKEMPATESNRVYETRTVPKR